MVRIKISAINSLKNNDLVTKCRDIVANVGAHVDWFPTPVPVLSAITTLINDLAGLCVASESRDRESIRERNTAREALLSSMMELSNYVELLCQPKVNAVEMIEIVGFEVWKSRTPVVLTAPQGMTAQPGPEAASAILEWNTVSGSHMYQIEFVEGTNVGPSANWQPLVTCSKRKVTITQGLTSAKYYSFRCRALGSSGSSAPSDVATCIVP
ncbi:MAG: hypothetical protein SH857_14230 [Chitinophagales bacterium]|nr:hypothetical protein [Chitinophagales bacterium]